MENDQYYMEKAIELAKKGIGKVNPNPMVGAVIVKHGVIIGEGYHEKYGCLHAERMALDKCNEDPKDSTLYVTLEPCCHFGKTPPCTDAIIKSKIKRVVIGIKDPNELVSGKGIEILKSHGIQVDTGVLGKECLELNKKFFHYILTKTPFVLMKYAMTVDGKIGTNTGNSKWITGEEARRHVHELRNELSGIMVGIKTVLTDDPLLTCRIPEGRNPIRIICDSHLRIPLYSKIVKTAKDIPTIVATISKDYDKRKILEGFNIKVLPVRESNGRIDLNDLLIQLGTMGIDSILLEGGATLNESALSSGIVNRLNVYIAPKIFGGTISPSPIEGTGISEIEEAYLLTRNKISVIGDDILLQYDVEVKKCLQD
ncbi:diaminohydroxyphosphoribosylaminopyrimidine deaminase/5-amino-6-(5-phosphoribosylamino)uracil reductase [Mobilisporobacter senegalensis]|uniref:Riboflavin biosynthesis protein RibD n=1 Tax=Mobilisporobacter senegalensis TaxID=1329262 RepID=A0A3N1XV53_9FIRM|nr:bifunctional diaminohydroxyphosphoribosylaminopyrimidine deaminase/5-amino-6-(5-phosphoribosylamino)uracil reductase RibD [Mobilisporobacter senegalensis]ROR30500.1 diaminohydroxyphosphoribosylaminopyrimidine deaminase/5-amino-6-(5-phosphoribosylamino)uracil reductase [Mobilisporobacter senegalensis]